MNAQPVTATAADSTIALHRTIVPSWPADVAVGDSVDVIRSVESKDVNMAIWRRTIPSWLHLSAWAEKQKIGFEKIFQADHFTTRGVWKHRLETALAGSPNSNRSGCNMISSRCYTSSPSSLASLT
jgi:hypothetical protein